MKDNKLFFPFEEEDLENNEIDFICTREVDVDELDVIFIDFKYDGEVDNVIGPDIFKKRVVLDNDYYDDFHIENEFIEIVSALADVNIDDEPEFYDKFNFNYDTNETEQVNQRRLITKINNHSNLIATSGRIGPAQYYVISEENYKKFNLSIMNGILTPIFHDIDDILLFRKNQIDQPGILYVKNTITNKYDIITLGFKPQKQFGKIKLN